ncbi:MAG: FadR family transcriptional regulator [Chloroflexi bacterium]|nr:FadR family transcriptional regulator [Chloroflexota bacterium]
MSSSLAASKPSGQSDGIAADAVERYMGAGDLPAGIHATVVQRIGRRIVTGELTPGEILPEQGELSRLLNVSRTVVREATRVLIAKGLVESRPKRGTVVLPRSSWHILDPDVLAWQTEAGRDEGFLRSVFEIRHIIEPGAARLAAEHADGRELRDIQAAFEDMGSNSDESSYLKADVLFHGMLVAATHNDYLIQLVGAFGPALHAGLQATIRDTWAWEDFLEFSLPLHRAVLDAVMARDPDRAEAAMRLLVEGSRSGALEGALPGTRGSARRGTNGSNGRTRRSRPG